MNDCGYCDGRGFILSDEFPSSPIRCPYCTWNTTEILVVFFITCLFLAVVFGLVYGLWILVVP